MFLKSMFTMVTCAIIALFFISAAGAQTTFDFEKMERDLTIAEKVLDELLSEAEINQYYRMSGVKGVYVGSYGAVIMMNMSPRRITTETSDDAEAAFDLLQTTLAGFMLDYASVMRQVKEYDWVTLVVNRPDGGGSDFMIYSDARIAVLSEEARTGERFQPYPFIMTARKSEIDRASRSDTSPEQFRSSVSIARIGGGESDARNRMNRSINIMNSILEATLEGDHGVNFSSNRFQGTYLDGYGVLFIVSSRGSLTFAVPDIPYGIIEGAFADAQERLAGINERIVDVQVGELQRRLNEAYNRTIGESEREREQEQFKRDQERANVLITSLTEAIGDYGHTIRGLEPDENITIFFTSNNIVSGSSAGRFSLMLTATYKDILDYSRGAINLDTFKTRVRASTFE
ncbi:hypothetical protein ACFL6I_07615 [candidate division KSB1 bacterium]